MLASVIRRAVSFVAVLGIASVVTLPALGQVGFPEGGGGSNITSPPSPGDIQTLYNSAGLDVLDASAFGDNVDIDTGALSFQHTDVSLPDNSGLPVTISRRFGRDTIDGAGPGIGSWITMTFSTRNGRTVSSTTFRLNRKTGRPQRIPSK